MIRNALATGNCCVSLVTATDFALRDCEGMSDLRRGVDQYLRRCFATEETPRVSELASLRGMTRERLSREFAAECGVSLSVYLKRRQMRRAQHLLAASALSTTRIGYACGFGTRRTFYRAFRRGTGMSPDRYRRIHTKACSSEAGGAVGSQPTGLSRGSSQVGSQPTGLSPGSSRVPAG